MGVERAFLAAAVEDNAGRFGFVDEVQAYGLVSQFWGQMFQRVQVVAVLLVYPFFARAAALRRPRQQSHLYGHQSQYIYL